MCGICGAAGAVGSQINAGVVARMAGALVHRGPDEGGLVERPGAVLGARRLSIIDLAGGSQPVSNEDGTVWVAFNGEIYNHNELRAELTATGHRFRSRSDTEVLAHAYEEWGAPGFLRRLNGMFALAIADDRAGTLLLARDRFGIKPLYYAPGDGRVTFASEIAPLRQEGLGGPLDAEALPELLAFGYLTAPRTFFRDIRALLPGHSATWDGARLTTEPYWRFETAPVERGSDAALMAGTWAGLEAAVERHLISDVEVGLFLSGGIDSAAVGAAVPVERRRGMRSFSVGFEQRSFDESRLAEQTARFLGTRHETVLVGAPSPAEATRIALQFGQPFADSSAIAVYYLARLAAERVKVVLTGDGGDEVFAGYETYVASEAARYYRALPEGVRGAARAIANAVPASRTRVPLREKLRRFTQYAPMSPPDAHASWRRMFADDEVSALLRVPPREVAARTAQPWARAWSEARRFMGDERWCAFDLGAWLPDDLMVKVDVMTMASSLEARVPLLDHCLVDQAFRLPPRLKRRGVVGKRPLREYVRQRLGGDVHARPKMGFNVPVAEWLLGPWSSWATQLLLETTAEPYCLIDRGAVARLLGEHRDGVADHSFKLWSLMTVALFADAWRRR
jgi:asparagine synthase (glutamine-hydrolysing)